MRRREFLTANRKHHPVHPSSHQIFFDTVTGLTPYTGTWDKTEVVHLLKRVMFGASKADIDYFLTRSMSEAVDELLNPTASLPAPPLKDYTVNPPVTPDVIPAGQTWVDDPNTDGTIASLRRASFKKWWTGLMINQDRSIREKLTLFWHNHFSTETADVSNAQFIYKHHALLRSNCLGNFKSLVKAVTIDPGMLVYLSGNASTAAAPNENYARELQELFTIGKENNPNYTEDDVKAAARVLTGWRSNAATISSSFDSTRHDKNNKQFSSFYNSTVITGRTGSTAGDQEIDDLLTMIFSKKAEVSKFIVKKIYRWFCYYTIDADTQSNVIDPLAQIFQESNWDIKPVLSALFKSEHFYDAANMGCMIKSPADMATGFCREFNLVFPDAVNLYADAYGMWDYIRSNTANMNQSIGDPPNVAGWPAYYQEPQYHELWINSDTLPKRNKFTDQLLGSGYTRNNKTIKVDPVAFAQSLSNPRDPNQLIDDSLDILFQVPLSDASKQTVKVQILLTGQQTDHYWSDAWDAYIALTDPSKSPYKTIYSRLAALYKYFLELPEYQLS